MNPISFLYQTVFFKPLLNGLVFLIAVLPLHDMGLAIIALTLIVRLILFPFNHRAIITQMKMRDMAPELARVQEKFKGKREEQAAKVMELYKAHGVSPFSGFLTLLIQIPIIIALYQVFLLGTQIDPTRLYSFIALPGALGTTFLGLFDLTSRNVLMSAIAAASQYVQAALATPPLPPSRDTAADIGARMATSMKYIAPGLIFVVSISLPSAVSLYWTTMNIFAIVHESVVRRRARHIHGTNERNNEESHRNAPSEALRGGGR